MHVPIVPEAPSTAIHHLRGLVHFQVSIRGGSLAEKFRGFFSVELTFVHEIKVEA